MSWGRSLASSSPNFSRMFALARVRASCLGRGVSDHLSLLHSFSLGDPDNKLGSGNYAYFCVIKATGLKTKQRQLACQAECCQDRMWARTGLQLSARCFGENVEGRRVHPAVNKYDRPGHSSLFTLLQEKMIIKTHPSIYKKQTKNKNTNFQEPVFELLSTLSVWDSAEARGALGPPVSQGPEGWAHRDSPNPRTSAPLTGVNWRPRLRYLTHQLKPEGLQSQPWPVGPAGQPVRGHREPPWERPPPGFPHTHAPSPGTA